MEKRIVDYVVFFAKIFKECAEILEKHNKEMDKILKDIKT